MVVNYYYSLRNLEDTTVEHEDDELLQLCRSCARKHADQVQWASRGDEENECEFCYAANDPQRKARLDVLFARTSAAVYRTVKAGGNLGRF